MCSVRHVIGQFGASPREVLVEIREEHVGIDPLGHGGHSWGRREDPDVGRVQGEMVVVAARAFGATHDLLPRLL